MDYRKIWESYHGKKIPVDENGRTFEIHHRDGNRANNDIENLICLSIDEHYQIHHNQQDWFACASISRRMNLSEEQRNALSIRIAESNRKNNADRNKRRSVVLREKVKPALAYYKQSGEKLLDVAKKFNVSYNILRTMASEAGVTRTKGSYDVSQKQKALEAKQQIESTINLSCAEASKLIGISKNTVAVYRRLLKSNS